MILFSGAMGKAVEFNWRSGIVVERSDGGLVGDGFSPRLSELSNTLSRPRAGRGFEDASCVISSIGVTSDHD